MTDPDGRIVLWNSAAKRSHGWSESDVLDLSIVEVLAPPDRTASDSADLVQVAGGSSMTGDRLVVVRDGTEIRVHTFTSAMVDDEGNIIAIVGSSQDVGGLRLAEQRARNLSEHFRSALAAGGLGTWRWDLATGETTWDTRMEELFGLDIGSFDGRFDSYVANRRFAHTSTVGHPATAKSRIAVRVRP